MHRIVHLGLVLGAWLGCAAAIAQGVVRCGNAYGEQACPGGTLIPADDPRTQAQRAQARAVIARDARMANALEAARLKAESEARPGPFPALLRDPAASSDRQETSTKKARTPPHFTAIAPRHPGEKGRAQRTKDGTASGSPRKPGTQGGRAAKASKPGGVNAQARR